MSVLLEKIRNLVDEFSAEPKQIEPVLPFDYKALKGGVSLRPYLKIGKLVGSMHNVVYPALMPVLQMGGGLIFELNDSNRDEINFAIQHYVLQLIEGSDEGVVKVAIGDARGMGSNFRFLRKLDKQILTHFAADDQSVRSMIEDQYSKSVTIIGECLTHYSSLADYNVQSGHTQPFRLLLLSDFPNGFGENLDKFTTLISNASKTGLLVFITYDSSNISRSQQIKVEQIINEMCLLKEFGDPNLDQYAVTSKNPSLNIFNRPYTLRLDRKDIQQSVIEQKIHHIVASNTVQEDQLDGLRIPIGKIGGRTHNFTFGYESDVFHAMIGGQPGMGKSVLLSNILARGIEIYSPDELRFILIDCSGVGFHEFDEAEHMQAVCRSSDVETCIRAVQVLDDELRRRENLFQDAKVDNLRNYVKKTGLALPRLVCVIDEFHVLYTGKDKYSVFCDTVLVSRVIRIGRKFGVHLVTCTQSLGGGVRKSLLDNIPLRIALGMTTEQSTSFFNLRNDAASGLTRGVAVYNPRNGDPNANQIVRIDYLQTEDITNIISVAKLAHTHTQENTQFITQERATN